MPAPRLFFALGVNSGAMKPLMRNVAMLTFVVSLLSSAAAAQTGPHGTIERIKVHGKSLEGNLEGDSPDRDVSIYLPPSYKTAANRRYPVVYFLHGYTDSDDRWFGLVKSFVNLPAGIDKSLAGGASEMIVVMPNAYTRYQGSMYSSSVVTGDWEAYIVKDLIGYIDSHYRTIPNAASRGLAGHSMGGYGTMRIGMKYPEVFSAIYALSPCCMIPNMNPAPSKAEGIHTMEDFNKADFGTKAQFASAAVWSPNPKNPPFFFDLPTKDGAVQGLVIAKWAANAPLAMVDQYLGNLKKLHAIAFDAGDKDTSIAATIKTLDGILNGYDLAHTFEIYPGTHVSGIQDRIETKTMLFFSKNLAFEHGKH
jgi:S-formylglutathione hydrolase